MSRTNASRSVQLPSTGWGQKTGAGFGNKGQHFRIAKILDLKGRRAAEKTAVGIIRGVVGAQQRRASRGRRQPQTAAQRGQEYVFFLRARNIIVQNLDKAGILGLLGK